MPVENVEGFENCICHHPDLINLYGCKIGSGTKIGAFVEIGEGVVIGKRCKIQSGVYIPPGVAIGDNVFIGPNVTFTNCKRPDLKHAPEIIETIVMNDVVIGANATILPGIMIGRGAFIGAGSVVTRTIPTNCTVCGNPARVCR